MVTSKMRRRCCHAVKSFLSWLAHRRAVHARYQRCLARRTSTSTRHISSLRPAVSHPTRLGYAPRLAALAPVQEGNTVPGYASDVHRRHQQRSTSRGDSSDHPGQFPGVATSRCHLADLCGHWFSGPYPLRQHGPVGRDQTSSRTAREPADNASPCAPAVP